MSLQLAPSVDLSEAILAVPPSLLTMVDIEEFRNQARKAKETGDYSFVKSIPHDPRFPNINQTK